MFFLLFLLNDWRIRIRSRIRITDGNEKNMKFADIISSKETKTPIKFMII